jgi:hypothetical protein
MNALTATALLLQLLQQATALGNLIRQAQAENRDITPAELDTLAANDSIARAMLGDAITRARAEGR